MMSTTRKQYQLFPHLSGDRVLGYRQVQVFDLIRADLADRGIVRTYDQIAECLGMCGKVSVCNVIGRLEGRGLVRRPRAGLPWFVVDPAEHGGNLHG